MTKKKIGILALSISVVSLFALSQLARPATVFLDDFSTGNFANWSNANISAGSSQNVINGVARFTVPTPLGGSSTYSYVIKNGFTSTVNSTIIAAQDIYATQVPNGSSQGNGAIFFLYVCDSSDLSGGNGNFGVGIDGSNVWSVWLGGTSIYTYIFQTAGPLPVSNTWYHIVLTINNPEASVTLTVNDTMVIYAGQQQFTDKTRSISLMSGMGEDWWCEGLGQQEVDIDNVKLDISDAPMPTPSADPPSPTPNTTPMPDVSELQYGIIILLLVLTVVGTAFLYKKATKHQIQFRHKDKQTCISASKFARLLLFL